MKKSQAFPSRWLKIADLPEEGRDLTVKDMTSRAVGEEREKKPVMAFVETKKELIINSTRWDDIVAVTADDDSDHWIGLRFKFYPGSKELRNGSFEMVRVRAADSESAEMPF